MAMKRTTILRWTGAGDLGRLKSSVEHVLGKQGLRGTVGAVGSSVIIVGPEPITAAAAFRYMPGVAWVAAGFAAGSGAELAGASARLARAYLKRGDRFSVQAESGGEGRASDAAGMVVSKILDAVKGARVSESPRTRFRVAVDGAKGVVGAEVAAGPGGAPTGDAGAVCLVSGGAHSSVVAWLALVAGFRAKLVHAAVNQDSVLAVAKLYSELSNRVDARGLSLEVLEGGPVAGVIDRYLVRKGPLTFAGFHSPDGPSPKLHGDVASPLFLMPEERFKDEFQALGVKAYEAETDWGSKGRAEFGTRTFSGGPASVSEVLDGLE